MKLLFITQKIDADDDLLGVYHEWVKRLALSTRSERSRTGAEGLAPQFEKIHVIALMVGKHDLPRNVVVHSLGKEMKRSRVQYVARFFKYIWQFRNEYDAVFVHMNTEYVLLGGWLWKLLGKRVVLWFAHYRPDWKLQFSASIVDTVVTSVPEACKIASKKVRAIGQAIDTQVFYPAVQYGGNGGVYNRGENPSALLPSIRLRTDRTSRKKNSLLFLGRIAPVKKLEILIDAFAEIKKSFSDVALSIIGEPGEKDGTYNERIKKQVAEQNLSGDIVFLRKVSNTETPAVYNQCEVFVNLTPTGSFDKTILEAMACETIAVVSNRAYEHIFPDDLQTILLFRENDSSDLALKLKSVLALSPEKKTEIGKRLRECVVHGHSMEHLISALAQILNPKL